MSDDLEFGDFVAMGRKPKAAGAGPTGENPGGTGKAVTASSSPRKRSKTGGVAKKKPAEPRAEPAREIEDPLDDPMTGEELERRHISLADSPLTVRAERWLKEKNYGPGIKKDLSPRLVEEAETKRRQLRLAEVQAVHARIIEEFRKETQRRAAEEALKRAPSLGERPMEYQAYQWFLNDQRPPDAWGRAIEAAKAAGRQLNLAEVQKLVADLAADEERARETRRREYEALTNRRPDETATTVPKEELVCRFKGCGVEIQPWVENITRGNEVARYSSGPCAGELIITGCFACQFGDEDGRATIAGFCDEHRVVYRNAMIKAGRDFDKRLFSYEEAKRLADRHNGIQSGIQNGVDDLLRKARPKGPARPARYAAMHGGSPPAPDATVDRGDKNRFRR